MAPRTTLECPQEGPSVARFLQFDAQTYFVCFAQHPRGPGPEREIFVDNLLVRVHLIIEMSRPALRQGSLNSLFQVALCPRFLQFDAQTYFIEKML